MLRVHIYGFVIIAKYNVIPDVIVHLFIRSSLPSGNHVSSPSFSPPSSLPPSTVLGYLWAHLFVVSTQEEPAATNRNFVDPWP